MQALPRNLELVLDRLSQRGPCSTEALETSLRESGLSIRSKLLTSLPQRYPNYFHFTDDGSIGAGPQPVEEYSEPPVGPPTIEATQGVQRVSLTKIAALELRTTGLDPGTDSIAEVVLIDSTGCVIYSGYADSVTDEGLLVEGILRATQDLVAMCGHNLCGFDLPFLEHRARLHNLKIPQVAAIDTLALSILANPDWPDHSLVEVAKRVGVHLEPEPAALDAAAATLAVLNNLVRQVDAHDDNWQLTLRALELAEHPLCAVLPPLQNFDQESAFRPRSDELLEEPTTVAATATTFASMGLRDLQEAGVLGNRTGQTEMAYAVGSALDDGRHLAIEAPTGTGKTLAYLLPALGRSTSEAVVVATATKLLQDQLRDEALRLRQRGLLPVPVRQIQGIANYICTRNIAEAWRSSDHTPSELMALAVATRGLSAARNGVWEDLNDRAWGTADLDYRIMKISLRTDSEQCQRQACEFASRCPFMNRVADYQRNPGLVVTNHAVVATWIRGDEVTNEEAGDRAPVSPAALVKRGNAHIIFDEAHELEDSLTSAWTVVTSELLIRGRLRSAKGRRGLIRELRNVEPNTEERLSNTLSRELQGLERNLPQLSESIRHYVEQFGAGEQVRLLRGVVSARPEFRTLRDSATSFRISAIRTQNALRQTLSELNKLPTGSQLTKVKRLTWSLSKRIQEWIDHLDVFRSLEEDHLYAHLLKVETRDLKTAGAWMFQSIPIDIGPMFERDVVQANRSIVLTSATLRAGGSWNYLESRLGITVDDEPETGSLGYGDHFETKVVGSPFDFGEQSRLILTNHLPTPSPTSEKEFVEEMAADQVAFQSLSGGRTLSLFASRKRMEATWHATQEAANELAERGVQILLQGTDTAPTLVRRFRADLGTSAFGTKTFWQGFDAPGETLSYLFLEKPPYPSPADPLISARQQAVQDRGGDPFLDYIVPKTAILFAQGFGRLIRTVDDRGVALVYDRRMQAPSPANQILLDSLPAGVEPIYALDRAHAWTEAIKFVTGNAPNFPDALRLQIDRIGERLEELRIRHGDDPAENLATAADELFGIPQLRPEQLKLMLAVLDGKDVMGVLPTGFGKSVCFQLPALLHPANRATVVVSPLIALIKDQVDDLRGRKGLRPVQGITGTTSASLRTEILRDVAAGKIRLLYLSPERLARDPILQRALKEQQLTALVVDEAHCVSVWGHDFRPEFRQIPKAVASFTRSPRIALTATATPSVEADIVRSVGLDNPVVQRLPADRPNLHYYVKKVGSNRERARELLRVAQYFAGVPGIVYASRRATTEELAHLLRSAGFNARHYHAGLVPEQRIAIQEQYLDGLTDIIVATKAFGMGINKPDIGWIVHYDLPESLDGYAQESGRAARTPGSHGHCVLLWAGKDKGTRWHQAQGGDATELLTSCTNFLKVIETSPLRAGDHVIDPNAVAEANDWELDEMNRMSAWLERLGVIDRKLDCSGRGMLTIGFQVPDDEEERKLRRELTATLRLRPGVRRQIDFSDLSGTTSLGADELEDTLVRWTLARSATFTSSQRLWRFTLSGNHVDRGLLESMLRSWNRWQQQRLGALLDYAEKAVCRRISIARHFGDEPGTCSESGGVLCDICDSRDAAWSALDDMQVPDPETLIDLRIETLRAVLWASRYSGGNYGEASLKRALLGYTQAGSGQQLGRGVLACPQFGAVKYLRNAQKQLDDEVQSLIGDRLIERVQSRYQGHSYSSLAITDLGVEMLQTGRNGGRP